MLDLSSTQSNPLLGIWRLVKAIAILPDGTIEPDVYGANPSGYITYTPEGRMMVLFARSDRPFLSQDIRSPFSKDIYALPAEECMQAFLTCNAYAGKYTLSGNTITHHIEIASIPNRVGTDLVRTFELNGNQVTLKTPPTIGEGISKIYELVWERLT
jgi:Lipocalin-like domain